MTTLYIHNFSDLTVIFFCFKMNLSAISNQWIWRRTLTISPETLRWSQDTTNKTVLAASSLNLETVARITEAYALRIVEQSEHQIIPDKKITVDRLVIYDASDGGKEAQITFPKTGHTQTISLGQTVSTDVAAGSTANVANALRQMGTQDTGIIGAVGGGTDGSALIHSLTARGFNDLLLVRRTGEGSKGGTAKSLFLKTPDGKTIILSLKPPYGIADTVLQYLKTSTTARIIICSGFMPYEFPLVDALFSTETKPKARILSPHRGCFTTPNNRQQCLDFAERADLLHLNGAELQELLGIEAGWSQQNDSAVCDILRHVPAKLVCITLNKDGSVTYIRDQHRLIRQPASPATRIISPIGAGDVHMTALIWYLWLRERKVKLEAALASASWIAGRKIEFDGPTPRPWDGILESEHRKQVVHQAEETFKDAPEWDATPINGS